MAYAGQVSLNANVAALVARLTSAGPCPSSLQTYRRRARPRRRIASGRSAQGQGHLRGMASGAAARATSVTGIVRPAYSSPPRRGRTVEVGVPRPTETFSVAFDSLTKDDFAADRAMVFALDLQQRFQSGEHCWPPVSGGRIATLMVGRSQAPGKRQSAYLSASKMACASETRQPAFEQVVGWLIDVNSD